MSNEGKTGRRDTRKRAGGGSSPRDVNVEWFNPAPNSADIEWLEDRGDALLEDCLAVLSTLQDHERVTLKYDVRSSRWLAILFDDILKHKGTVRALSVRGATALDALGLLSYFVAHKFAEGWHESTSKASGRFG